MAPTMKGLFITEVVTYFVPGTDPGEAMRDFLREPNKYLTGVEERDVGVNGRPQTIEDSEAINEAEMNS